jgi:hypothetical protein
MLRSNKNVQVEKPIVLESNDFELFKYRGNDNIAARTLRIRSGGWWDGSLVHPCIPNLVQSHHM